MLLTLLNNTKIVKVLKSLKLLPVFCCFYYVFL